MTIAEHVYSCQYGTFIGNCCKQRDELKLREDTYSLWGYLTVSVSQEDQFLNPLYNKSLESEVLPIQVGIFLHISMHLLQFCESMDYVQFSYNLCTPLFLRGCKKTQKRFGYVLLCLSIK